MSWFDLNWWTSNIWHPQSSYPKNPWMYQKILFRDVVIMFLCRKLCSTYSNTWTLNFRWPGTTVTMCIILQYSPETTPTVLHGWGFIFLGRIGFSFYHACLLRFMHSVPKFQRSYRYFWQSSGHLKMLSFVSDFFATQNAYVTKCWTKYGPPLGFPSSMKMSH